MVSYGHTHKNMTTLMLCHYLLYLNLVNTQAIKYLKRVSLGCSTIFWELILLFSHISGQVFRKDDRVRLSRTELFKNTLRKSAHAWELIQRLHLTGKIICEIWSPSLDVWHSFVDAINVAFCVAEEEALKLRSFIDEPAYTDLHWVCMLDLLLRL
jgi:hypothetical protein